MTKISRKLRLMLTTIAAGLPLPVHAQVAETERVMLSGHGPDDAVPWDFVIDGGMGAGNSTTIPVPSNWQQQGFGHYQYGYDKGPRAADRATYRRRFDVPADWKDRTVRLVFDGVMTDALVRVNGVVAGPLHQGGFSRFRHDVTKLLKPGQSNVIEVDVSEASAAKDTDIAERHGDYWVFGGIFRPVWFEVSPVEAIDRVGIDARADGTIVADVSLSAARTADRLVAQVRTQSGEAVGAPFMVALPAGGVGQTRLTGHISDPALWSAETPNLYRLDVTLLRDATPVHHVVTRFGFRTFELREGQGLFLNGQRILLKGANRHSFRPATGRALSRENAYADVRMLRDLNMNAVRMSHYAPEESFLEAADELGLYVIDELTGWQHAHDTEVGRRLVRELVERDRNHPSILLWTNGNEGGWNRELDGDFPLYDPQARPVLHPWELHAGIDTKHYPRYADLLKRLAGSSLVMPTEFLHALYDGGGGSGLDDYWRAIVTSPRGAGGFLWNLADEGIARRDRGGAIDTAATLAPDGIVGPDFEKEPSYFTVRDIWSPVQIDAPKIDGSFDGRLTVRNQYDFTPLSSVRFTWKQLRFAGPTARDPSNRIVAEGVVTGVQAAPHGTGQLTLPMSAVRGGGDALSLEAWNGTHRVAEWTWPLPTARNVAVSARSRATPRIERTDTVLRLVAGSVSADFDPATGLLAGLRRGRTETKIVGGPRLVFARPDKGEPQWTAAATADGDLWRPANADMANMAEIDLGLTETEGWPGFTVQVTADGTTWRTIFKGARTARDGIRYPFAPQRVAAVRILDRTGFRSAKPIRSLRLGYQRERFPGTIFVRPALTTGIGRDAGGQATAWIEAPGAGGLERVRWTLSSQGTLTLDYGYRLEGPVLYHGIGLDMPSAPVRSATALVRGPWPVWQNRMRGPQLGVHMIAAQNRDGLPKPQDAGYFADPRWVRLDLKDTALLVRNTGSASFLQLGARIADLPSTSVDFPATNLGFLAAIPAMGAKFQPADTTGPAGQPAIATGQYQGQLLFELLDKAPTDTDGTR